MPKSKLTERQIQLVTFISTLQRKPVQLTLLQKAVFLCIEHVNSCDMKYPYKIGHFGPYSEAMLKDLEDLEKKGIVKLREGKLVLNRTPKEKWPNALKTVSEFKRKFPNTSSVIMSALTSPNVIGRQIGENAGTSS